MPRRQESGRGLEDDKIRTKARNNVYALLRSRPRSEFEVRQRLKLKGYSAALIDDTVENFRKTGDLDDEKFARLWVQSRMHMNPAGDVVLRHELKQKGIAEAVISAALEFKAENYDEHALALSIAEERFHRLKALDRRKALKRVYDFMLRRGFKYDTIQRILGELTGIDDEDR
jgi:regulatory protein